MRTKKGTVTSKSGDKSIVVTVERYVMHSKYHKKYRVSKKFHAHDEDNTVEVGDEVTIIETNPISKLKRWKVVPADALTSVSSDKQ